MKKISILLLLVISIFGCKKDPVEPEAPSKSHNPIANAGRLQSVVTGSSVVLDGSASKGIASLNLTYKWSFISKPNGSSSLYQTLKYRIPTL